MLFSTGPGGTVGEAALRFDVMPDRFGVVRNLCKDITDELYATFAGVFWKGVHTLAFRQPGAARWP